MSDHQDATLGLADALLVEGWGKPLGDVASQFGRAVGLLDATMPGTRWNRARRGAS